MSTLALLDNFRQNLIAHCKANGISQAELSRRSGVHFVTISRIFSEIADPSVEMCEKLAQSIGMRADTAFIAPEEKLSASS